MRGFSLGLLLSLFFGLDAALPQVVSSDETFYYAPDRVEFTDSRVYFANTLFSVRLKPGSNDQLVRVYQFDRGTGTRKILEEFPVSSGVSALVEDGQLLVANVRPNPQGQLVLYHWRYLDESGEPRADRLLDPSGNPLTRAPARRDNAPRPQSPGTPAPQPAPPSRAPASAQGIDPQKFYFSSARVQLSEDFVLEPNSLILQRESDGPRIRIEILKRDSQQNSRRVQSEAWVDKSRFDAAIQNGGLEANLVESDSTGRLFLVHPRQRDAHGEARRELIQGMQGEALLCLPSGQLDEADQTLREIEQAVRRQEPTTRTPTPPVVPGDELVRQRLAQYETIRQNLSKDFSEFFVPFISRNSTGENRSTTERIDLMQKLLSAASREARFQGSEGQARFHRLVMALTLYGEFGGPKSHRHPPHLYWASRSIDERVSRGYRSQINATFDPQNRLPAAYRGGRAGVALSPSQYSAWNLSDDRIDQILNLSGGPAIREIMDFLAAYDAKLFVTPPNSQDPKIESYVSPFALSQQRDDYPDWWYQDMSSIWVSQTAPPNRLPRIHPDHPKWATIWPRDRNGAGRGFRNPPRIQTLPGIRRMDSTDFTYMHVNPLHFEGATRR